MMPTDRLRNQAGILDGHFLEKWKIFSERPSGQKTMRCWLKLDGWKIKSGLFLFDGLKINFCLKARASFSQVVQASPEG